MAEEKKNMSRRKFIYAGAGVVAVAAVGGAAYYLSQQPGPIPPAPTTTEATTAGSTEATTAGTTFDNGDVVVNGLAQYPPNTYPSYAGKNISLNLVCDAGHNFLPWVDPDEGMGNPKTPGDVGQNRVPYIEKELGVTINAQELSPDTLYELVMTDFLTGSGKYDIITYFPTYNGDIMGGGWLLPLDDFIAKYDCERDDMLAAPRDLEGTWGGKTYGLPYDGDFHILYYRKDIFAKPDIQSKFKAKYGYDLAPPTTYAQYNDIAEFFTGWDWDPGTGPTVKYGTSEVLQPTLGYGVWATRFGSGVDIYFDSDMNPRINGPAGVQALTDLQTAFQFMPKGAYEAGATEVFDCLCRGISAMLITWPDVGPRAGSGEFPVKGDQVGYAQVPGYNVNGTLTRRAWCSPARTMAISRFCAPEKQEAAFQVIRWMNSSKHALEYVPSGLNGEDPFRNSTMSDDAIPIWQKSSPSWSTAGIKDYFAAAKLAQANGFPDIYLPAAAQYGDALNRYIGSTLKGEIKPKDALDKCAAEWVNISKVVGVDKQKLLWSQQVVTFKKLGLWPPGLA